MTKTKTPSELERLVRESRQVWDQWRRADRNSDGGNEYARRRASMTWDIGLTLPGSRMGIETTFDLKPDEGCQATAIHRDVWPKDALDGEQQRGQTRSHMEYRGACIGCGWVSSRTRKDDENLAVEDALDHAFPGWRTTPIVPAMPRSEGRRNAKAQAKLDAQRDELAKLFPDDWPARKGPNRVLRPRYGTRHVPGYGWWGGYEVAVTQAHWLWVEAFSVWFGPFEHYELLEQLTEKEAWYPGHKVDLVPDSPLIRRRAALDLARIEAAEVGQ